MNQNGCILTVDKVEFAADETRIYVTATNESSTKMSFYDFNAKIVQGSNQMDYQMNYNANYQEINSEILPGVVSSGIVTFPAVDSNSPFEIHLESRNENYSLNFKDYVFSITPTN